LRKTNEALEILEYTKSIKRLGMVLIENYIAKSLLQIDTKDVVDKLKKNISIFKESELKQMMHIYNQFIKNNKIEKLDFL
ncbi:hypothetical protein, partial [Aliarcobacter skirrowii]